MTIKISEVRAAYEATTPGEWFINDADEPEDGLSAPTGSVLFAAPCGYENSRLCVQPADVAGIVATHNAMPVFMEIVEAAMAWQDDPLELLNHKALLAALAKVTR